MVFLVACDSNNNVNQDQSTEVDPNTPIDLTVYGLNGPTSMGMIKMFEEGDQLEDFINISYENVSQPDIVLGKLLKGEIDIAALPTNLASIVYNKTEGAYKVAAVNTLGVLYIMTNEGVEVTSVGDLKGKTIYTSGLGATPEYVLNHILEAHGLVVGEDVFVEYKASHSEVSTGLISGTMDIVMLPQPFVTVAMMNSDAEIALSLQDEWTVIESTDLAMGCIVVKTDLAENRPEVVDTFLKHYETSILWVNKYPEQAGKLIEKHEVLAAAKLAELAIPKCNIVFMKNREMVETMHGILTVLHESDPKSVGGKLPDEGFYYYK